MYLFETGFGEIFKPRPKVPPKPPPSAPAKWPFKEGWAVKDGHRRNCSELTGGNDGICDVEVQVKFRRSFLDFLPEVENAYGRLMERSTARRVMKDKFLQKRLKELHQEMINGKVLDNAPIILKGNLNYHRSKGRWLLENGNVTQWWGLIDL
jgi:hypothetical protein